MTSQSSQQQSQLRTQKNNERRGWTAEETLRLIVWMQRHRSLLEGKKIDWYRTVAEEEFNNEAHITVQKVADKVTNMKRSWKAAKELQEKSEWGSRKEDVEQSVTNLLNRKCAFFWELDDIWRTTTNLNQTRNSDTLSPVPTNGSIMPSQVLAGAQSIIPAPEIHSNRHADAEVPISNDDGDGDDDDDDDAGDVQLDDETPPTPGNYMSVLDFRNPSSKSKTLARQRRSRQQPPARDDEDSRKRKKWLDSLIEGIKGKEAERLRWKEKREAQRMQLEEKRIRIQAEMERERIRSQERIAEMQVHAQEMHARALVAIAGVFTRVEPGSVPGDPRIALSRSGPSAMFDVRSDSLARSPSTPTSPARTSSFPTSSL